MMVKRGAYQKWTLEEEAELRRLWKEHLGYEGLATALGRTVGAIELRANLLGLNRLR